MNREQEREWMEAQGYKVYDHAGDAVGMTEAEKQEMDFRHDLGKMIRKRREALGLSQQDLAKKLKIGKRKVDDIEGGSWKYPLEEMLRAYSALDGRVSVKELPAYSSNGIQNGAKPARKKAKAT